MISENMPLRSNIGSFSQNSLVNVNEPNRLGHTHGMPMRNYESNSLDQPQSLQNTTELLSIGIDVDKSRHPSVNQSFA